jgi:hypothetical protein
VASRKGCLAVLSEKTAHVEVRCAGFYCPRDGMGRRPGSTLTSWDKLEDIAAESDLSDGVVPGDRLSFPTAAHLVVGDFLAGRGGKQ